MQRILFFLSLSFFALALPKKLNAFENLTQLAFQKQIAKNPLWLRLLHYKPQMWGLKVYSQVDDPHFFLSPEGSFNSEAELIATLKAFLENTDSLPESKIAQCRFPARFLFLQQQLNFQLPVKNCPQFAQYLQALSGTTLSLVFSSFYLNNPSSAYGHTFIRIHKFPNQEGQRFELLDYGINFAAEVNTSNAFIYSIKGLFGFFPGKFTALPYYYKVREYNDAESRDLWEYELNLTPQQVEFFIAHIWELAPAFMDYWFLTENCSYHMLTALEVTDPNLHLTEQLKKWVIPTDTVKIVTETPGLVRAIKKRPSARSIFFERVKKLSTSQKKTLKQIVEKPSEISVLQSEPISVQKNILDSALDYYDFIYAHDLQKPSLAKENKNKFLLARSKINSPTEPLPTSDTMTDKPHLSHGSRRILLGAENVNTNQYGLLGVRYALHDYLDPVIGYPEYAAITFADLVFKYNLETHDLNLKNLTLFEVASLSDLSLFMQKPSWQLRVGWEEIVSAACPRCFGFGTTAGLGASANWSKSPKTSLLVAAKTSLYHISWNKDLVWDLGPNIFILSRWNEALSAQYEFWYKYSSNKGNYEPWHSASAQYSPQKNWGLRLNFSYFMKDTKSSLNLHLYY